MRHLIRQRMNKPRPEDYLPYSTTHQHRPTWRWPFLGLAFCLVVIIALVGVLLGQQAQFERYTEDNREHLCDMLTVIQYQNQRELYQAYSDLRCDINR